MHRHLRGRLDVPIFLVFETILTLAEHDYLRPKSAKEAHSISKYLVATNESQRTLQCYRTRYSCR